ncbi:MAG: transposase [Bacteroidetes bacterium]|nr:MAG: transposase [Bacteroidota bacterium]
MSRYKIWDQHGLNFVTLTVNDWTDVFIRKQYKDILLDSLRFCQAEKGLVICAYVVMSSHVHLAVAASGSLTLSDILRDFKKFTSRRILQEIQTGGYESRKEWIMERFVCRDNEKADSQLHQFWKPDNHPIALFTQPVIAQKIDYIHENPVKEGWVERAEHYLYSSASNYATGSGLLNVTLLDVY